MYDDARLSAVNSIATDFGACWGSRPQVSNPRGVAEVDCSAKAGGKSYQNNRAALLDRNGPIHVGRLQPIGWSARRWNAKQDHPPEKSTNPERVLSVIDDRAA
jgi:hypothetical protein